MQDECFLLFERNGTYVCGPFWTRAAVEKHLAALGRPGPDNAELRSRLEVKRYVIAEAEMEAA